MLDAFNRRDIDGCADATTPDFEWSPSVVAVDGEVLRGRDGIETYFGRTREAWAAFTTLADKIHVLGDRVRWVERLQGRGLASGAPVDAGRSRVCIPS
jgi:ketosteroid isomerase-like protein